MPSLWTTNLDNCVSSLPNLTSLSTNVWTDITITANDGFTFQEDPYVNTPHELNVTTEDNIVYTGQIRARSTNPVYLYATAVNSEGENPEFSITLNLTNATSNLIDGELYVDGEEVRIEVTADEGYYFATAPVIYYDVSGVTQTIMMLSDDTEEHKSNFYYELYVNNDFVVKANAQVIPETDKYGIITMYNPTPNQLKQVGEIRYMGDVDLGNYIANVIKLFVKIPQGKTATVLIGGYNTGVESNVITNDIIETDCDTVEIVGKYGNAMDYENTKIEAYLPFIGFVELDTQKVMNETLKLIYKTNVINGDSIACIYNTTGTLLYTFNCNASFEIPYRLNADIESKGKLNVDSNYLFGFTPFVTIRYNKAYNSANMGSEDDRYTTLENESGFVKCSEVFNTINTTKEEREEIDTLLKEGVLL